MIVKIFRWINYQLKMLRHRPRLLWNMAWVRRDEFHRSLNMDLFAMLDMNKKDRSAYIMDLVRRREIAHNRDLEKRA